jgi:plastocyanin
LPPGPSIPEEKGEALTNRTLHRDLEDSMDAKSVLGPFYSVPLLGLVLFVFSIGFPPFDDATTLDLTTHMVQHIAIVIAGVLVAYPLHKKRYFTKIEGKNAAYFALVSIIALITFWHIADFWDAAVLNPLIHAGEHFSFLLVGILIGSTLQTLSDRAKIDVLLLGFFGHFAYGLVLISQYRFYPLYSLSDQGALGIAMFGVGPFYWTGILYLIFRNRAWFTEVPSVGGERAEPAVRRTRDVDTSSRSSRRGSLGLVTPVLTVVLVAVLVGFYAMSAVAIGLAPPPQQPQPGSSVRVLILETPVTWAYSPDQVTVVIGVNNTVTWVSRSLSYDTVTGVNGTFDSGSIAPGQTFSHTFTSPGTFSYLCVYHPWMAGSVRVLPGR